MNYDRIYFTGDSFLFHMVRMMMGGILMVGMGQKDEDYIKLLLKEKTKKNTHFVVPAQGLFLEFVQY